MNPPAGQGQGQGRGRPEAPASHADHAGLPDRPDLPDRPVLLRRTAEAGDDGRRLDQLLASWLDEPRARTQARIAAGEVAVAGRPAAKSHAVRAGEQITVVEAAVPEPLAAHELPEVPVRYSDEHLLVVAKPAGLVVHPGAGRRDERRATLVDVLARQGVPLSQASGDPDRPGIVHRLDRGTSGVLVVAKTDEAYTALTALFKTHGAEREYWAIVDGVPDPPHATVDAPIGRSTSHRTRFRVDPEGRHAVSHYDVLEDHGRAAVVRVRLETGRTHQVRVHMMAVGHPVSGDRVYGASPAIAETLGLSRPALHARRLAFTHPVTGQVIEVEEPLPADLTTALDRLRRLDGGVS